MRLDKAEQLVEKILEKYPRTRTSDHVLYRAYYWTLTQRRIINCDFATFFTYPEKYGACNFATIERCRRKLQHYRPELKNETTAKEREYKQAEFIDYSRKERA